MNFERALTQANQMDGALWHRISVAKQYLTPRVPKYCIAWEDPDEPTEPVKVTTPSSNWLASAIHGGVIPPVHAYHQLNYGCWVTERYEFETGNETAAQAWCDANDGQYEITNGHVLHQTTALPMTEEQAMEYLVKKDIPPRVWAKSHNRDYFYIVKRAAMPDRRGRSAWRLRDLKND